MINTLQEFNDVCHKEDINSVCGRYMVSEMVLEQFADQLDWKLISMKQRLSEAFIEKHAGKVNWFYISKYQQLSEAFMDKHKDKIVWSQVGIYKKNLSVQFIEKYKDHLNFDNLRDQLYASEHITKKYGHKFKQIPMNKSQKFVKKSNFVRRGFLYVKKVLYI